LEENYKFLKDSIEGLKNQIEDSNLEVANVE